MAWARVIIEDNLQKTPAMMHKRNTVNERLAAWLRTAHGCLDTLRRRAKNLDMNKGIVRNTVR